MSPSAHEPLISRRHLMFAGASTVVAAAVPRLADAHPAHVTMAEAELAGMRAALEVALRVHAADLEVALRRAIDHRLRLEDRAVDSAIARYLNPRFVLRDTTGTAHPLHMVGSQLGVDEAWLYFDFAAAAALTGWTLEHRVFFELATDQVNTVVYRAGGRKTTLQFRRDRATRTIP